MKNKVCIVTGANTGIGKSTALGLAKLGARVVLICRNRENGEKALNEISEISGNENIDLLTADFSSLESVRKLSEEYKSRYEKLDVLVNNAGTFFSGLKYMDNNIEMQFGVNHLAPFLLTNLLLNTIKNSAPARVINVSSYLHFKGAIHFDDLNMEKNYNGMRAYSQSKLANVLFTYELSRRLKNTGVTANCVHPGGVSTDLGQKNTSSFYKFFWIAIKPFMITPEKGARTSIYLASSEKVDGITGKYFVKCKPKKSSRQSYDENTARRLWKVSEELTKLCS